MLLLYVTAVCYLARMLLPYINVVRNWGRICRQGWARMLLLAMENMLGEARMLLPSR